MFSDFLSFTEFTYVFVWGKRCGQTLDKDHTVFPVLVETEIHASVGFTVPELDFQ